MRCTINFTAINANIYLEKVAQWWFVETNLYIWYAQAARRYCPHHVGHYLGMDVHDTPELSRSQPLQPGMVITIEPGTAELLF